MENLDEYFDLTRTERLCKGDSEKINRYLIQFSTLMTPKVAELEEHIALGDKEAIRKVIHFMAPQLEFFGRAKFRIILNELNTTKKTEISADQLAQISSEIYQIKKARALLDQHFFKQNKAIND